MTFPEEAHDLKSIEWVIDVVRRSGYFSQANDEYMSFLRVIQGLQVFELIEEKLKFCSEMLYPIGEFRKRKTHREYLNNYLKNYGWEDRIDEIIDMCDQKVVSDFDHLLERIDNLLLMGEPKDESSLLAFLSVGQNIVKDFNTFWKTITHSTW